MLPQGIFSVAVATVLFPMLARLAARGDTAGLRRTLDGGLRQIAFLLFPAGLLSIVLAEPIVRLVYQRGEFTAEDTVIVAQCLQAFSIGLVFNGWMLILNRSFYAVQTNWTPTAIALGAVALNATFDTIFYRLGIWGIPLATSTVNVVAAIVLLVMMRRRLGLEHVGRTIGVVLRIAAASVLAAAAAFVAWYALDAWLGEAALAQIVSLGAGFAAGGVVYIGASRALGLRELEALLLLRAQRSEASDQR
jgi:putative peptidoglycan lipid II flippase